MSLRNHVWRDASSLLFFLRVRWHVDEVCAGNSPDRSLCDQGKHLSLAGTVARSLKTVRPHLGVSEGLQFMRPSVEFHFGEQCLCWSPEPAGGVDDCCHRRDKLARPEMRSSSKWVASRHFGSPLGTGCR